MLFLILCGIVVFGSFIFGWMLGGEVDKTRNVWWRWK